MLKKLLSALLVLSIAISLFACGKTTATVSSIEEKPNSITEDNVDESINLEPTENIYWYQTEKDNDWSVLHMSSKPHDDEWTQVASNAPDAISLLRLEKNDIKTIVIDDVIIPKTCYAMFEDLGNLSKIVNIENLNTSLCTDMSNMFRGYYDGYDDGDSSFGSFVELDLSHFDTRNVEKMDGMFEWQTKLESIDISSFDFSKIKVCPMRIGPGLGKPGAAQLNNMFWKCKSLKTIYSNKDIKVDRTWETTEMFKDCINLIGGNGTPFNPDKYDISMATIDSEYQAGYLTYDPARYYWKNGYYYINGIKQTDKWITDKFDKYYVDKNGKPLTNTWKDNKYLSSDGKMLRNTKTPDNKFVNYEGDVVDTNADYDNIDESTIIGNSWLRTENGIWYYFEDDRTTLKKGWFDDPQDEQRYYLDLDTGIMLTGWQEIDGNKYYFNERPSVIPNWYYVPENDSWASYGKKIKSLGSMFRDEETPDGKKVDSEGRLIE